MIELLFPNVVTRTWNETLSLLLFCRSPDRGKFLVIKYTATYLNKRILAHDKTAVNKIFQMAD